MKVKRLFEVLNELDYGGLSGAAGRPDDSGIRSKGLKREPITRLINFPYDRDTSYGEPAAYDRGNAGSGGLHRKLTPKDDSGYSEKLLGVQGFDPKEIEEIMGSPILLTKGITSQMGSSVPGTGKWSSNPYKEWERGEFDEDALAIDTSPPDIEEVPVANAPDFRMQTDDDLENRLNRIWGGDSNLNFVDPNLFAQPDSHMIAPDPWSVINTRLSSRGLYGLMPKESSWDRISGMTLNKRNIE